MLLPTDSRLHGPLWPARMLTCSRVVSYHSHQRLHLHRTHWLSPLTVHCMCCGACLPARRCSAGLTPLPSGRLANCISYTKRIVHRPSSNCGLFVPCSLFFWKKKQPGTGPQYQKKTAGDRTPVPKKKRGEPPPKKEFNASASRFWPACFRTRAYAGITMKVGMTISASGWLLATLDYCCLMVWSTCGQHVSSWCRWSELTG